MSYRREYLVRLPLPLAQLYSRAFNARDPRSRHDNAFYLWEALIKLATAPAIACYADEVSSGRRAAVPSLDKLLLQLALPSLGHWMGILRELSRHFGSLPDARSHQLGHLWNQLHQKRADRPAMLGLYRRIKHGVDQPSANDSTFTLLGLLESLVQYRNGVFGHGGPRFESFYQNDMGPMLLPAATEVFEQGLFDFLGPPGSRLVYLDEIRQPDPAHMVVHLRELVGLESERMEPLSISRSHGESLRAERIAILWPSHPAPLRLDPLLAYRDSIAGQEVLFLNRDRSGNDVEYLSYTTGRTERDGNTATQLCRLLSQFAHQEVTDQDLQRLSRHAAADYIPVEPASGERFGRYQILEPIGSGGMASVYLAEDTQLGRRVALKVPNFREDDSGMLQRFQREARAASMLQHPNICPIYDFGNNGGRYFIAMAHIQGRELAAYIQPHKPHPERRILIVIRKLALALGHAHQHGIVHRDLKPANVIVDERGEPIIMDFGLAKQMHADEGHRLTQDGIRIGSPAYMAPEQIEADNDLIAAATDQYALGVILYELLTGELPFAGTLSALFHQILSREPSRPTLRRPALDPRIEAICLRMMAKRPEDRFSSMRAVADAIASILRQPGGPAAQATPAEQTTRVDATAAKATRPVMPAVSIDAAVTGARNWIARQDYDSAIQTLEAIPENSCTQEVRDLFREANDLSDEVRFLLLEIDEALALGDGPTVVAKCIRLAKIKPDHPRAKEIRTLLRHGMLPTHAPEREPPKNLLQDLWELVKGSFKTGERPG